MNRAKSNKTFICFDKPSCQKGQVINLLTKLNKKAKNIKIHYTNPNVVTALIVFSTQT